MNLQRRKFIKAVALSLGVIACAPGLAIASSRASKGLKNLFSNDFEIGTVVGPELLINPKKELLEIVKRDFGVLTTENIFKWENIHPTDGHWNWVYADEFVAFGKSHDFVLHGHPLLWHSQIPVGVFHERKDKPLNRNALLAKLESHVSTIADRYKGAITSWDVVNEAFEDDGSLVQNRWLQTVGPDYIHLAFRAARAADSRATLIYNDYNLWKPEKRDRVVQLIREFKAKQVPIDAIGIQGHIGLDYPDLSHLSAAISAFAREGVRVHLSELEVDVLPSPSRDGLPSYDLALDPYRENLPDSVSLAQAKRYEELFKVLLKHRDSIDRVTIWGVTDDQSWKNDFPIEGRTNHALLFDRDQRPKPAYHAIAALKS